MESDSSDSDELYDAQAQQQGAFSWIPELDQASLERTHAIENSRTVNFGGIGENDFDGIIKQILGDQYFGYYDFGFGFGYYEFAAGAGNLSGVRFTRHGRELNNVYIRSYNSDWNKFLQDIRNYFAVSRTIDGNIVYSSPSLTQRTDLDKSPKENAVTFLKFLDLAFKKNDGTGGLVLNFGYDWDPRREVINLSDVNALERIVAHFAEEIRRATQRSIRDATELAKYLAVSKRDIWNKIDQTVRPARPKLRYAREWIPR